MSVRLHGRAWSVGLTALTGAWIGHFLEYTRVAGWHAGLSEMSAPVHAYFFPAGAALTALVVGVLLSAGHAWRRLGRRIGAAETGLWKRPAVLPGRRARARRVGGTAGVAGLWFVLAVLQTATWVTQENLEALGAGHRAPLWGVLSGTHWLAPVVQAEVALILAAAYSIVQRSFSRRRSRLETLEHLVARRWARVLATPCAPAAVCSVPCTPLLRWGRQRWLRPPPPLSTAC